MARDPAMREDRWGQTDKEADMVRVGSRPGKKQNNPLNIHDNCCDTTRAY